MEQCKYSALVKLNEPSSTGTDPPLEPGARIAVRARHHETGTSMLFSALIVVVQENSVLPRYRRRIALLEKATDSLWSGSRVPGGREAFPLDL